MLCVAVMKEAINNNADLVVLDMDTPGGSYVTLEIMQEILWTQ